MNGRNLFASHFLPSVLAVCLLGVGVSHANAQDKSLLRVGEVEFGYWAPQVHEMYVRVPIVAAPVEKDKHLGRGNIKINGREPDYVYWYNNGLTSTYTSPIGHASERDIHLYIPLAWRAGQQYRFEIGCTYGGRSGALKFTRTAPETGGIWAGSRGANQAFMVREEAGHARVNEPVEFDVTVPAHVFPQAPRRIAATIMIEPGVFEEIPCQIYAAEQYRVGGGTSVFRTPKPAVRFRACVQLSIQGHGQKLVHLWAERPTRADPDADTAEPITMTGEPIGGVIESPIYRIELDDPSGQLFKWHDKRLNHTFEYSDWGRRRDFHVINRTPDLFIHPKAWSHALDWGVKPEDAPQSRAIAGPVFCETVRWGLMPWTPQVHGQSRYRFYANRPEVRVQSAMRVVQEMLSMGFRNGGVAMSPDMFTHGAWSRQDGQVVRRALVDSRGNDSGGRPESKFDIAAPWYALYHADKGIGFAVLNIRQAHFNGLGGPINTSRRQAYISLYGGKLVYMIRSANQTWNADHRSYPSPMKVGETLYEEFALLPFRFDAEDEHQFDEVTALLKRLRDPLVIVP